MHDLHSRGRLDPDTRAVVLSAVALVALLGLVSFAASFAGLVAVAEWAELPGWLRWAVPTFVDGALLAYTLAIVVQRARGESTRFSWLALGAFTAVSIVANALHVIGARDVGDWRTWVGAGMAALAPLGVFAATHTVVSLAIARPDLDPDVALAGPAMARELREGEGLSHRAIAARMGVSKSTIARWLSQTLAAA